MNASGTKVEITLEKREFQPGEILRGRVLWSSPEELVKLRLRLGWYVGKGDCLDVMSHCEDDFLLRGSTGTLSFELILPQAPLSSEGELFSLSWSLEGRLENEKQTIRLPISLTLRE